jgi:hypothetical protein
MVEHFGPGLAAMSDTECSSLGLMQVEVTFRSLDFQGIALVRICAH